jgi:hypothetical protein
MRVAAALIVCLTAPAAAEPLPGCNDGSVHRMITAWHGAARDWVEFYSEKPASGDGSFLFDRWTLLHCPSGVGVGVRGFPPFPYPDDDPSTPAAAEWLAGVRTHEAIGQAIGRAFPAGRRGADEVTARLREAGVAARTGPGDRGSCVCDPAWRE